jgi:DNA topoisomerase-1
VDSAEVNACVREIAGDEFSAKDFRTWAGTIEMAAALMECGSCEDESEANSRVTESVKRVAERLGNTPAVCRECYIHPEIIDRYLDGTLAERLDPGAKPVRFERLRGLTVEESAVLAVLEAWSPEPSTRD